MFIKQIKYTTPHRSCICIFHILYISYILKILSLVIKLRKWSSYYKVHIPMFMFHVSKFKSSYSFHVFKFSRFTFSSETFLKTCSSKSIFFNSKLKDYFQLIYYILSHFLFHFWYLFCYVRVLRNHEIGRWLSTS